MFGAYVGYQIIEALGIQRPTLLLFLSVVLVAGAIVALIGMATERLIFRKIYNLPPLASLLGTFGLLLIIEGVAILIWGVNPASVPFPKGTGHAVQVFNAPVSIYTIVLSGIGAMVAIFLALLIRYTALGNKTRALAEDRFMAELVGINTRRLSVIVFLIGTFLAGLGGALATPMVALTPDVATAFIIEAFAVVIVGGLGSIAGSLVAALAFGIADSLAVTYYPPLSGIMFYLFMFIVLILRPQGIFGKVQANVL